MKVFEATSDLNGAKKQFTENDAPDWLTSCNTVPGSTMDNRWFWEKHVLALGVGATAQTDYHTIRRIS